MTARRCPNCGVVIDPPTEFDTATFDEIIAVAADRFVINPQSLVGYSRTARVVAVRHAVISVIRQIYGLSYPELGRLFSRDHTTIMNSVRRADTAIVDAIIDDLAHLVPTPEAAA